MNTYVPSERVGFIGTMGVCSVAVGGCEREVLCCSLMLSHWACHCDVTVEMSARFRRFAGAGCTLRGRDSL